MRMAASTVGCHARRRLFTDTHTIRPHLADLHAGVTGDEDIEFAVTFDHIGTLCHADIADTGEGTTVALNKVVPRFKPLHLDKHQ